MLNSKKQDIKYFQNELNTLKLINHLNVVKLIDGGQGMFSKKNGKFKHMHYIVLEYIKNGELFDFIFHPQKGFGEELGRLIFVTILDGLEACHKAGIVHRDIKPENIMVSEDYTLKLADFGFAVNKDGKEGSGMLKTALGTPNYAAPELHLNKDYYGTSNDIFALSVTLFVLITGAMPFKSASKSDSLYSYFFKNDYEGYWAKRALKVKLSDNFKNLFQNLTAFEPTQRPSMDEIKMHPWILEFKKQNIEKLKAELNEEFQKRKMIVDYKRKKEKAVKDENKGGKMAIHTYRSRADDEEHCSLWDDLNEVELDNFKENDNPYVVVFPEESDHLLLFKKIFNFFSQKSYEAKISIKSKKYKGTAEIPSKIQNVDLEESNKDLDNLLISTEESLVLTYEIESYNEKQIIVNFMRKSGDKLRFHNIYQHFVDEVK